MPRRPLRISLILAIFCLPIFCKLTLPALADTASSVPDLPSLVRARNSDSLSGSGMDALSERALEVAKITGILPLYQRLLDAQKLGSNNLNRISNSGEPILKKNGAELSASTSQTLETLAITQRIIYLRTEINQYLQTANLEVNSVLGKLNSGMAGLADSKALIADERARILRRNSFVNLISGGLTKIGGYTTALTPSSPIPTNVLEVFDGVVQTSLSLLTLREQRNESKLYKTKPDILTSFVYNQNQVKQDYPESVWTYLRQRDLSHAGNQTRRQILLTFWISTGRLSLPSGSKSASISQSAQPTFSKAQINKMDDIDDSVAMMSDLTSAVSEMETSLMELSQVIKDTYKNDPPIE